VGDVNPDAVDPDVDAVVNPVELAAVVDAVVVVGVEDAILVTEDASDAGDGEERALVIALNAPGAAPANKLVAVFVASFVTPVVAAACAVRVEPKSAAVEMQ
jgi:hypothetical protein